MLIRLIPRPPLPTVLFTLAFLHPPEGLPIPANFVHQLQQINADELELPGEAGLYALDNAAWLVSLLREVTFNIPTSTVSCVFRDGAVEEWPLMGRGLADALEQVVNDVEQSAVQAQREERKVVEVPPPPPPPSPAPIPEPVTAKRPKHKRQRSLLMTLVHSFVAVANGSSRSSSAQVPLTPASPKPPSEHTKEPLPPDSALSSRALRRRARSTLVDAYNRFVITELRIRVRSRGGYVYGGRHGSPYGGYAMWIAHSMLRRAQAHMDHLVQEAGGLAEIVRALTELDTPTACTPRIAQSIPFPSSEDTAVENDTDVDGGSIADNASTSTDDSSSIQTPLDGGSTRLSLPNGFPRTPTPPCLSLEQLDAYNRLFGFSKRIRHLIKAMEDIHVERTAQEEQCMQVLEIKSRRRAWSTKRLLLCDNDDTKTRALRGALVQDCGLGVPIKRSPLGWCLPVSSSDTDARELSLCRSPSPSRTRGLRVTSAPHDISSLFPVSEEDEADDDELPVEVDAQELDLEAGYLPHELPRSQPLAPPPAYAPPEPPFVTALSPAPRPRMVPRSRSEVTLPLLCQPLPSRGMQNPMIAAPEDVEFTLGIDVPRAVRSHPRYDHDEWLPGIAAPPGLSYQHA